MKSESDRSFSIVATAVRVFVLAWLFILPLWGRCLYESQRNLAAGNGARDAGDMKAAIFAYSKALRWRAPGNSSADMAGLALEQLEAKLEGDILILLLREMRRSLFISRSFYSDAQSDRSRIARIDQKLQQLGARIPSEIAEPKPFRPLFSWQLLSQLGFWLWVCAVLLMIRFGFTREGKLSGTPFTLLAGAGIVAFALWLFALANS